MIFNGFVKRIYGVSYYRSAVLSMVLGAGSPVFTLSTFFLTVDSPTARSSAFACQPLFAPLLTSSS